MNGINSPLPVLLIINRAKDTERKKLIEEQLARFPLRFEFIEAVDGYSMDVYSQSEYDQRNRLLYIGQNMTPGEIGCLLSHRKACQKIVDENISCALILEDDVRFEDDLVDVLEFARTHQAKWDILRFLNNQKALNKKKNLIAKVAEKYNFGLFEAAPSGAYAYLVTHHGAQQILKASQHTWRPIDVIHAHYWLTKLKTLSIIPAPVTHNFDVESTIGQQRFEKNKELSGFLLLLHYFYRFWYKISVSFNRRFHYFLLKNKI